MRVATTEQGEAISRSDASALNSCRPGGRRALQFAGGRLRAGRVAAVLTGMGQDGTQRGGAAGCPRRSFWRRTKPAAWFGECRARWFAQEWPIKFCRSKQIVPAIFARWIAHEHRRSTIISAFLRQHVYAGSGIVLDTEKQYLLEARLAPILRERGLASLRRFVRGAAHHSRSSPLHAQVVEAMTTNETYFFREPAHYDALRQHILPELMELRRGDPQAHLLVGRIVHRAGGVQPGDDVA